MEEFLKKGTMINLVATLLFFVIGVILVITPYSVLNLITYSIEVILILFGIVTVVNYIRVESKNDVFGFGFVQGVVCILIAIFLIINPEIIITILPICIGIWMVFGSLYRMQIAVRLNAWGKRASLIYILLSILMFAMGFVIICNPFKTAAVIVQMLGGGIIIYSVLDIIQIIGIMRFLNKLI